MNWESIALDEKASSLETTKHPSAHLSLSLSSSPVGGIETRTRKASQRTISFEKHLQIFVACGGGQKLVFAVVEWLFCWMSSFGVLLLLLPLCVTVVDEGVLIRG